MDNKLNKTISKSFYMMFIGLLISAICAYVTYSTGLFETILARTSLGIISLIELGVVIVFSLFFHKFKPTTVKILFIIYAIINGISLSVIFAIFKLNSIVSIFLISSLIFLVLAYLGSSLKTDLTKYSKYIFIFLIAGFILSLLNVFFFKSTTFELVLGWIMLIVFFGVTIYDINKVKYLEYSIPEDKLYVYVAMDLYLDFINIFVRMLSFFGKEKD